MIRPFTCLCMMLAAGSGMYLYQEKHRSQLLDEQIVKVLNAADANRERERVLRAEYQLLQDPQRMEELASQHLALVKIDPKQFANWATIEKNIPVVAPPATAVGGPVEEPPAVGPAAEPPALSSAPTAGPPAPGIPVARGEPQRPAPAASTVAARAAVPQQVAAVAPASRTPAPSSPAASAGSAAPMVVASAAPVTRNAAAANHGENAPVNHAEAVASARSDSTTASAMSGHGGPGAGPAPQRVALTVRRPTYGGTQAGGGDATDRFSRSPPAVPAAAPASALGMARMLATPTFVAPQNSPLGSGG